MSKQYLLPLAWYKKIAVPPYGRHSTHQLIWRLVEAVILSFVFLFALQPRTGT